MGSIITLIAVLARGLGLLAALDTGAFIALSLAHLGQNACLGAASLETLQSAVQGLAFLDMDTDKVKKAVEGMSVVKTILVKNKLVNLIVKPAK